MPLASALGYANRVFSLTTLFPMALPEMRITFSSFLLLLPINSWNHSLFLSKLPLKED